MPVSHPSPEQEPLFTFRLSQRLIGLPLAVVKEVAPFCALSSPPAMPACLVGLANVRGTAVPVLRLDRLLELPESTPGLGSQLLFLRLVSGPLALVVDEALGIRDPDEVTPIDPAAGCSACALAEAHLPEGTALVLDPDRLLLAREKQVTAHLQQVEQQRLAALEGVVE